jgi:Ca2+-binding EF-hand superfamily protein
MKSKILTLIPVLALVLGTIVFAESDMDTDGDGVFSFAELVAGYPDLSEETFTALDTDGDGSVSEAELAAAVQAGTIPALE